MSWAKVKKINSDMSRSLDKLIIGQKRFVATDTPLLSLSNGVAANFKSTSYKRVAKFQPGLAGTLKFKCTLDYSNSSYYASLRIVDSAGTVIMPDVTASGGTTTIDKILTVDKDKIYYAEAKATNANYYVTVNNIQVCGDIVDYNWISGEGYTGES